MNTNSGTRYFYCDPLEAAYMVKHHGITLTIRVLPSAEDYEKGNDLWTFYDDGDDAYLVSKLAEDQGTDFEPGKFYIHPDDLHLLDPRVGDTISHLGLRAWRVDAMDETAYHHPAVGSEKVDRFTLKSDRPTIIQREGKPFFWPESEAV